ncbi:MAG: hypothetical protein RL033_6829 [Pseudomonadota bacterium]|jgi:MbtH protein
MEHEDALFLVVMNHEEQYSIWPAHRAVPAGWRAVEKSGKKAECLAFIEATWTDLRPRSLRERLSALSAAR